MQYILRLAKIYCTRAVTADRVVPLFVCVDIYPTISQLHRFESTKYQADSSNTLWASFLVLYTVHKLINVQNSREKSGRVSGCFDFGMETLFGLPAFLQVQKQYIALEDLIKAQSVDTTCSV